MAEQLQLKDNYKTNDQNVNPEDKDDDLASENEANEEIPESSQTQNKDYKYNLFESNQKQFVALAKYLKYEQEFIEKEGREPEDEADFRLTSKLEASDNLRTLRSQSSRKGLQSSRSINNDDSLSIAGKNNTLFNGKNQIKMEKMRSYLKENLQLDIENNEDFQKFQKTRKKEENQKQKKGKFGIHLGKIFNSRERLKHVLKLKFIFDSPKYIMTRYYLNRSSKYFFFINNIYKITNVCMFLLISNPFIIDLVWLVLQSLYFLWILLACPFERWFHSFFVLICEAVLLFFIGKFFYFELIFSSSVCIQ